MTQQHRGLAQVRVAIAQQNYTVGDLAGNAKKIEAAAHQAAQQGAKILLTPELSLTGYPPEDLLLRPSFHRAVERSLHDLAQRLRDCPVHVLVGHPARREGACFNALSVLHAGHTGAHYFKHDLPNYQVFDERRYFVPDQRPCVIEVDGIRFGLSICEDTWYRYAPEAAKHAGAQVLLIANASPYQRGKSTLREEMLAKRVAELHIPMIYANMVGGQDELVFDGQSFAMTAEGQVLPMGQAFEEDLSVVLVHQTPCSIGLPMELTLLTAPTQPSSATDSQAAEIYQALVLATKDYVEKNHFPGVIIGLSGGIDSALTLAIAVDALGAERVRAIMMPSPYTADISREDAQVMAEGLKVRYDDINILDCMTAFETCLAPVFQGYQPDTTEENLQARIRGTMLMAVSNKTGSLVLTTGNKSEMATGYCTLYGDMAGGFAVLKDIFKTMVFRLARYRNTLSQVIPERIITRPPTAELRANQLDQDTLPPYERLDAILEQYMENDIAMTDIVAQGFPPEEVRRVVHWLRVNEYKRRQSPLGIKVTHRAFGRDWRYPVTSAFREQDEARS